MNEKTLQKLDLNLLKVFETMYQEQNMTRTAESLFLTPSAVSHAMRRLREALGDPLFERQGNRMQPTSACVRIAPTILENLNSLKTALRQFADFDPEASEQQFTLAIHDALEPLFIPRLLQTLQRFSPKLRLACSKLQRHQLQRQLSSGQADLAIDVALPMQRPIEHCPIATDRLVILRRRAMAVSMSKATYTSANHVTVSNRPTGRVMEDINLQQQSIHRKVAIRCQSYHTAKALLKQDDYLLTVPQLIAQSLIDDTLVIDEIPFAVPAIEIHLYWHENANSDNAIRWFKEQVISLSDR